MQMGLALASFARLTPRTSPVGQGSLLRKDSLTHHGKSREHEEAMQAVEQRMRAEAVQEPGETVSVLSEPARAASAKATPANPAPMATAGPAVERAPHSATGSRAIVAARALLEAHGSFNSIEA